jgi:hypothetical protein
MKRHPKKEASVLALIRCAVYTRKSTEEGLEQEFNSLDAQREAGEAFIKSQASEGWTCLPDRYDDGGWSGGNMERPALQRLMADIEAGRVDCVLVYKVDRLSRSLLDFARMMETFDKYKVSFVSVTQQFNTATSMGRLVLLPNPGTDVPGWPAPSSSGRSSRNGPWTRSPPPAARASGPAATRSSATTSTSTGTSWW